MEPLRAPTHRCEPSGGDCAEQFDVCESNNIEPGSIMIPNQEGAGKLSCKPYDKRVAVVVSGAGNLKPEFF
ncbi:MAG: hypothetical protein ACJ70R_07720 [Nitrososphaera sp.]